MKATTHLAAGCAFSLLSADLADANRLETALILAGGLVGSLLPDIDHPKSALGRRILPVSLAISAVFGHRGVTHSLIAVVVMTAFLWRAFSSLHQDYAMPLVLGVTSGYLSHLACDFASNSGIPLLWPLGKRYRMPLAVQTGGAAEHLIAAGLWALVAVQVFS